MVVIGTVMQLGDCEIVEFCIEFCKIVRALASIAVESNVGHANGIHDSQIRYDPSGKRSGRSPTMEHFLGFLF